jgi:hypothetical protein
MFCVWFVPVSGGSDFFFVRINSFNSLLQNVRIGFGSCLLSFLETVNVLIKFA